MAINTLSIKNKALSVNLDEEKFGVIAEIGGGQEVARAFFQAGGASGTIAKSISAYDKTFSDALYNGYQPGRYVCEDRLVKMLNSEYNELELTVGKTKRQKTAFFVFADTVETLNYQKSNQGHGWLGLKFQLTPDGPVNSVILHALFHENDAVLQQYSLGSLGVNLMYACFNFHEDPDLFLNSLMDNLDRDRVEVNMIHMSGDDLSHVDNRLLSVQLVKYGMTSVTLFDRNGRVMRPAELFYRKHVLVVRGSFRPLTYTLVDMLKTGTAKFRKEIGLTKENSVTFCEMTINNLEASGDFNDKDFLDRVDVLNDNGQHVMITDFQEFYKLSQYFNCHKINELRIVLGINTLCSVLKKEYYHDLPGGILQAMGLLFSENTALYAYPSLDENESLLTLDYVRSVAEEKLLVAYLLENRKLIDLSAGKRSKLKYTPRMVMDMICSQNKEWEKYVPARVASLIRSRGLFGYNPIEKDCTR